MNCSGGFVLPLQFFKDKRNMKNIHFILIGLLFVVSCTNKTKQSDNISSSATTTDSIVIPANFTTFDRAEYTVSYPATWDMKENFRGTAFCVLSPATTADDRFSDNVNLMIEPVSEGIDLEIYAKGVLQQILRDKYFKIVDRKKLTVNGQDYGKIILTDRNNLHIEQNIFLKNNKAYTLSMTYEDNADKQVIADCEIIMKSFRLK